MNEDESGYIKVKIFTYYTRRVRIYAPKSLEEILKFITVSRKQYEDYLRVLVIVGKAIEELKFENKTLIFVRPWLFWFWYPFTKKGFRAPAVIVDEELVSSGDLPDPEVLKEALRKVERKKKFLD